MGPGLGAQRDEQVLRSEAPEKVSRVSVLNSDARGYHAGLLVGLYLGQMMSGSVRVLW